MNLKIRRMYRAGKSIVITLPPDWLRGNGLGPGDKVEVWYDGQVHLRPVKKTEAAP